MAIFTGKHLHTIDEKNRLAIPSPIRKCINEEKEGKGFYITPGMDKCLALYSPLHFEETAKEYKKPKSTNKKARNFQRHFFSMSRSVDIDKQGRIIIPQLYKDYAGLKKDVVIVGVMDRIEIWDAECWNAIETENLQNFEQDAEDLFCLGSSPNP